MNAHALHLPEERGFARWTLAGLAILIAHGAIIAAVALWYARQPVEPNILPHCSGVVSVFASVAVAGTICTILNPRSLSSVRMVGSASTVR
jgi:hypothetical protein